MTKMFLYNNKFAMVHISYYPSNDEPIGDFYGSFTIPQLNNRERFIDTDANKYQHAYSITQQLEELREDKASPWLNAVTSALEIDDGFNQILYCDCDFINFDFDKPTM
jgi:hypothetical protein